MSAPSVVDVRTALARAPLEWFACEPEGFGLTTATDVQRAVMRAIEGRPLGQRLSASSDVLEVFGGTLPAPGPKPREVVLLAGVRSGKSLMAAGLSCRWSQCCDLSTTRPTDTPRINIASVDKDKARVVLDDHLLGTLRSRRLVSALYAGHAVESVFMPHPSGRLIETKVIAGKRAGGSLVSRWSAGTIFDEATRMLGQDEGIINLADARAAVLGRLLPGTQVIYVGSPYAPHGPVYELYSRHFGNPSPELLVIKARGPLMNPVHWTPARCEEVRRSDPDTYRTDVLGDFLTPEEALFPHVALEACTRTELDLPPTERTVYTAAMDPATRGNGWSLVIAGLSHGKRSIVFAREWRGSTANPLSPSVVLHEIAGHCHRYRARTVWTDQHSFDSLRDLASMSGLGLSLCTWSETEKAKQYLRVRAWLVDGELDLPPEQTLLADLRRVQRKAVATGIRVVLPDTGDGRHCDYAPAVTMALTNVAPELAPAPLAKVEPEVLRMRRAAELRWGRKREMGT